MILCIDPGLRGCGAAVFSKEGILLRAGYVKNPVEKGAGYAAYARLGAAVRHWYAERFPFDPQELLIEHPVIYPGMPDKDLNDLLAVVAVGAAVACIFVPEAQSVKPAEWKGQVDKKIMLARIASKLTASELTELEYANKSDAEDRDDAIGIGLHHFKRLNKKVIHR